MDIESIKSRLKMVEDYIKNTREMLEEKHPNCRCGGEAYTKELEIGGWYVGCKDCHISTTILQVEEDAWAAWDKVMK